CTHVCSIAMVVEEQPYGRIGARCASNNGAMHFNVTGSCPNTGQNTPISWNETDPQGPLGDQGAQGNQGPQGPAGQNGISHAYTLTAFGATITGQTATTLGTVSLPAGTYVVQGTVQEFNRGDSTQPLSCGTSPSTGDAASTFTYTPGWGVLSASDVF